MITLSWYTGVRPGAAELVRLKWEDVDWSRHYVFIRSAEKGGPKTRPMWKGKPIKKISTIWKRTKATAGIKRLLRPYDLRHAFVTYLLEDGADLKSVSSIVGHSNTFPTSQIYQHVNMNMMRATIAKVPP